MEPPRYTVYFGFMDPHTYKARVRNNQTNKVCFCEKWYMSFVWKTLDGIPVNEEYARILDIAEKIILNPWGKINIVI